MSATRTTFKSLGIEESKEFTTSFIPWFLEIMRKGLSDLNDLKAEIHPKFP